MLKNKEIRFMLQPLTQKGKGRLLVFGIFMYIIALVLMPIIVAQTGAVKGIYSQAKTIIILMIFSSLFAGVVSTYTMSKEIRSGQLMMKVSFGVTYSSYINAHTILYNIFMSFTAPVYFLIMGLQSHEWLKSGIFILAVSSISVFIYSVQRFFGILGKNAFGLGVWTVFAISILWSVMRFLHWPDAAAMNWLIKSPATIATSICTSIVLFALSGVIVFVALPRLKYDHWISDEKQGDYKSSR